ncbi:MAG: TPM domain-containing protein [Candidatus Vecturithrix sp.]|jgi:hypothetical protein|nr:TPM domain-containing protein [Candidatus Vecturithrix sp.]
MKYLLYGLLCWSLLTAGCDARATSSDFIDDQAELLTQSERQRISDLIGNLLKDLDIHVRVVILKEQTQNINANAVELFERFTTGSQIRGAKGVLFLVDPQGKQGRIDIGYDLEAVLPDAFVNYLMHKQMTPFFESNRVGAGIEATVELLVGQASGTLDTSAYLFDSAMQRQGTDAFGGAGARTDVEVGAGSPEKRTTELSESFGPQPSPLQTLETYQTALKLHIKDPNLGIYTPNTRTFFAQWLVTDAQQDNELKSLQNVLSEAAVYQDNSRAVIRFPISNRQAAPYLLSRSDQGWMLDFAAMNKFIGFNHLNQWFFRSTDHEFIFAFEDVSFDQHGFPHPKD